MGWTGDAAAASLTMDLHDVIYISTSVITPRYISSWWCLTKHPVSGRRPEPRASALREVVTPWEYEICGIRLLTDVGLVEKYIIISCQERI